MFSLFNQLNGKSTLSSIEFECLEIDVEPINCPYCNSRFLIEYDNTQKEIKCPDCKNIIELDWDEFDDDM